MDVNVVSRQVIQYELDFIEVGGGITRRFGPFAVVVDFQCSECGTAIKANAAGVEQTGEVICLNPDCGCRYFATAEENGFIFRLDTLTATCPECTQEIHIPTQKIALGYQFSCSGCNRRYAIVDQQWQFNELDNKSSQVTNED